MSELHALTPRNAAGEPLETMRFPAFRPEHLQEIRLQPTQAEEQVQIGDMTAVRAIDRAGLCWSAELGGAIVGACGVLPIWEGRAYGWAFIGALPAPYWTGVTRRVTHALFAAHHAGFWRIEASVRRGNVAGHRWVRALGFQRESVEMRGYSPQGDGFFLYARISEARLAAKRQLHPPETAGRPSAPETAVADSDSSGVAA